MEPAGKNPIRSVPSQRRARLSARPDNLFIITKMCQASDSCRTLKYIKGYVDMKGSHTLSQIFIPWRAFQLWLRPTKSFGI